jgi:hypothetical protein
MHMEVRRAGGSVKSTVAQRVIARYAAQPAARIPSAARGI